MNIDESKIKLGNTLADFKQFTAEFSPEVLCYVYFGAYLLVILDEGFSHLKQRRDQVGA